MAEIKWITEIVEINLLKPHPNNPRTNSKEQYSTILDSIRECGYYNPIICDHDFTILGGHHRLRALKKLMREGFPHFKKIEIRRAAEKLPDDIATRILVADNLSHGNFDIDILASLCDVGQLLRYGFNDTILKDMPKKVEFMAGLSDPDEIVDPPAEAVSRTGDIWILGNHRLMCGDCTNKDHVEKLLAGIKPNLMVTDPPYGVNYDPAWREGADLGVGERSKGKVDNDDRCDWRAAYDLFPGNIAYVWHAALKTRDFYDSLEAAGFKIRAQIIWAKHHFQLSRGDYHWQHEPCWYAVRKTGDWHGDRKQTTIWQIENNNSFGKKNEKEETFGHGTQKPIECMKRPILNNSSEGQAIYDPFVGSGTTIMAAEITARVCYAMEINPIYCDMAVQRWEKYTGKKAALAKS